MARSSRQKGARGEREVRDLLREYGFAAERGAGVRRGANDVIHNIPNTHIEVKRCERIDMPGWRRQAMGDAHGATPVVVYRRSNEPWWADLPFEDLLVLWRLAHA